MGRPKKNLDVVEGVLPSTTIQECLESENKTRIDDNPEIIKWAPPKRGRMTKAENAEWDAVYKYIQHTIMQYDDNQNLPQFLVMRAKGLAQGVYMARSLDKVPLTYGFRVVLLTFIQCTPIILNAFASKEFKDEHHKINYMMKIVESHINDVYLNVAANRKIMERIQSVGNDSFIEDLKIRESMDENQFHVTTVDEPEGQKRCNRNTEQWRETFSDMW